MFTNQLLFKVFSKIEYRVVKYGLKSTGFLKMRRGMLKFAKLTNSFHGVILKIWKYKFLGDLYV